MHQESKVVALRLAPDKREPARDKPATARSVLPRELAEDLRWVLRQLHGVDTARPECEESDHSGTRRWIWTSMATAALIAAGASLWIVAANEHPSDWRGTPTHETQASPLRGREARATLDLVRIEDATRVQQRLVELGFFVGKPNGIWGPRSRQALREFKAAHALVPDGHWNANIQARLFDVNAQRKAERGGRSRQAASAHSSRNVHGDLGIRCCRVSAGARWGYPHQPPAGRGPWCRLFVWADRARRFRMACQRGLRREWNGMECEHQLGGFR